MKFVKRTLIYNGLLAPRVVLALLVQSDASGPLKS